MIRIIPGEWRARYPRLIDEMHKLRRSVFHERLKWQVTVINRWEIDGYDALDPLYVLSLDEDERVIGGLRLLPTTGFNMLNDTFSQLLPDHARIQSPLIWESSRFTVKMTGDTRLDAPVISRATAELGRGGDLRRSLRGRPGMGFARAATRGLGGPLAGSGGRRNHADQAGVVIGAQAGREG